MANNGNYYKNDEPVKINKTDLGVDNLKGVEFKMSVNSKKYDELMSMMYIFRIRVIKRSSKSVIEINGNLATVCDIKNASEYCDLLYPLSDYEYNMGSNLFIYAEPDVITDIDIYFNPVISHDFDKLTPEEMDKYGITETEEPKAIDDYWEKVIINSRYFTITDRDKVILKYLTKVKIVKFPENVVDFRVDFYFKPNEFFTNEILSKKYI